MQKNTWPDLKPWFDEAGYICDNYPQTHQFFNFLESTDSKEYEDGVKVKKFTCSYLGR